MALSGYEKQKRWREKHRALYNLQQRNRRKKGGDATLSPESTQLSKETSNAAPTVQPSGAAQFHTKKVGEFRMLVMPPKTVEDEPTMPVAKPKVFFNDHGAQISEKVWNVLQEKKRIALESGYEFDPQWI